MEFERGNTLERNADAVVWSDKAKVYVELDTGSMPLERVRQRWESYRGADGYVVVVALKDARMQKLKAVSESIAAIALFCVLEDVLRAPHEPLYSTTQDVCLPIGELL